MFLFCLPVFLITMKRQSVGSRLFLLEETVERSGRRIASFLLALEREGVLTV